MNVRLRLIVVACLSAGSSPGLALELPRSAAPPAGTQTEQGALDPRGRPDEKFVNVATRYYVWHDTEGWHLRTASRAGQVRKFQGTIKLTGGTFNKLREIGLESKGRNADASQVNADRTKIEFTIFTSGSYDGYDFTIKGDDARVTFELLRGGKPHLEEIFIGGESQHPPKNEFGFPAVPKTTDAVETP